MLILCEYLTRPVRISEDKYGYAQMATDACIPDDVRPSTGSGADVEDAHACRGWSKALPSPVRPCEKIGGEQNISVGSPHLGSCSNASRDQSERQEIH